MSFFPPLLPLLLLPPPPPERSMVMVNGPSGIVKGPSGEKPVGSVT
jgi:hypothetical protein